MSVIGDGLSYRGDNPLVLAATDRAGRSASDDRCPREHADRNHAGSGYMNWLFGVMPQA